MFAFNSNCRCRSEMMKKRRFIELLHGAIKFFINRIKMSECLQEQDIYFNICHCTLFAEMTKYTWSSFCGYEFYNGFTVCMGKLNKLMKIFFYSKTSLKVREKEKEREEILPQRFRFFFSQKKILFLIHTCICTNQAKAEKNWISFFCKQRSNEN